jgi:hypothetical protein
MSKRRNAKSIDEKFVAHRMSMLESPAYMVLSRASHQLLARIEIEHMRHGGAENGSLTVTYTNFESYRIHRHAIAPAIRECEALGFIEITEHGRAGNRDSRRANKYRLTYCVAKGAIGNGTHEWRGIKTIEEAEERAKTARRDSDQTNISVKRKQMKPKPSEKQKTSGGKRQVLVAETTTKDPAFLVT